MALQRTGPIYGGGLYGGGLYAGSLFGTAGEPVAPTVEAAFAVPAPGSHGGPPVFTVCPYYTGCSFAVGLDFSDWAEFAADAVSAVTVESVYPADSGDDPANTTPLVAAADGTSANVAAVLLSGGTAPVYYTVKVSVANAGGRCGVAFLTVPVLADPVFVPNP